VTNLQKYTIASVLRGSMWWMAVGPLYFMTRGLTMEQVYIMISAFSVSMVIFEFPTGVVADRFSHKKSVVWSGFLGAILQFAYIIPAGFYFYLAIFILVGVSSSMRSGSNVAVLHSISNNFQKDLSKVRTINFIWISITTLVGGWLFTINIILPYVLNGLSMLLAVILFNRIKVKNNFKKNNKSEFGNIYKIAGGSLKHLKRHKKLRGIVLASSMFLATFFSYKYSLPVLFDVKNIPIIYLSTVMSLSTIFLALGTALSSTKYYIRLKYTMPLLLLLTLLLGFMNKIFTLALVVWGIYFLRGMFSVRSTVLVNKYSKNAIRASVMSLKSLTTRILMALYMLLVGKISGFWSFEVLSVITFSILSIFVLYFVWTNMESRKLSLGKSVKD
jgi:MFS family permease